MRELSWKCAVGITLLLLVVVAAGVYLVSPKQDPTWGIVKEMKVKDEYDQVLYVETGAVNRGNTVIASSQETTGWYPFYIFPGKYIFLRDVEYSYDTEQEDVLEIKKAVYTVCDLKTGEEIRTIDAKEIAEKVDSDMKLITLLSPYIIAGKDREVYLKFFLEDNSDPCDRSPATKSNLYVSTETGECIVRQGGDPLERAQTVYGNPTENKQENTHNIWLFEKIELEEANGFIPFYCEYDGKEQPGLEVCEWGYGILEIKTLKKYLPEHNEKLYGEFPGLKEYEGEDDDIITLYVVANDTVEEVFEWLLEDGEEISFEGYEPVV